MDDGEKRYIFLIIMTMYHCRDRKKKLMSRGGNSHTLVIRILIHLRMATEKGGEGD